MDEDELEVAPRNARPATGQIPPQYLDAIDRASEADRRFFEYHPDLDVRRGEGSRERE
jgi:hypothetical protein